MQQTRSCRRKSKADSSSAALLFLAAFVLGLTISNLIGKVIAVILSSFAIYLLVQSFNPSERVLRRKDDHRDKFVAFSCSLVFLFVNVVSNILVPLFIEMTQASTVLLAFLIFAMSIYMIFEIARRRQRWAELFVNVLNATEFERREKYERVMNALVLVSVFLGLDGSEVTNALTFIVLAITLTLSKAVAILGVSVNARGVDLEEALWHRVFHLMQYRKGLAFMSMAFTAGIPFLFFSHSLDLLNLKWNQLLGLLIFATPVIPSLLLVKPPFRGRATMRRILRQWAVPVSFVLPIAGVVYAHYSSLLLPSGVDGNSSQAFAWLLASFPFFVGFPLFHALSKSEENDLAGFVRWMRPFGLAPLPVIVGLLLLSPPAPLIPALIISDIALALGVTSGFYLFTSYAVYGAFHSWQVRYGMRLDDFVCQFGGPCAYLCIAAGLGACIPLAIFLVDYRALLFFEINAALIATALSLLVVAVVSPRVSVALWSTIKIAAACATGEVLFLVLFFGSLGGDMVLWLMQGGNIVLATFASGSLLAGLLVFILNYLRLRSSKRKLVDFG